MVALPVWAAFDAVMVPLRAEEFLAARVVGEIALR